MPIAPGIESLREQRPAASPAPTKWPPAGSSSLGLIAGTGPERPITPMCESEIPIAPGFSPPVNHPAAAVSHGWLCRGFPTCPKTAVPPSVPAPIRTEPSPKATASASPSGAPAAVGCFVKFSDVVSSAVFSFPSSNGSPLAACAVETRPSAAATSAPTPPASIPLRPKVFACASMVFPPLDPWCARR